MTSDVHVVSRLLTVAQGPAPLIFCEIRTIIALTKWHGKTICFWRRRRCLELIIARGSQD